MNQWLRWRHEKISDAEQRSLAKQLLEGVVFLHEHCEIVHKNLHPNNIIVSEEGELKITDCGPPSSPFSWKSWAYQPPEVLASASDCSGTAIDAWSVGCILHELATSKQVFPGRERSNVLAQIMEKNFLCVGLLEIDRHKRQTCQKALQLY